MDHFLGPEINKFPTQRKFDIYYDGVTTHHSRKGLSYRHSASLISNEGRNIDLLGWLGSGAEETAIFLIYTIGKYLKIEDIIYIRRN